MDLMKLVNSVACGVDGFWEWIELVATEYHKKHPETDEFLPIGVWKTIGETLEEDDRYNFVDDGWTVTTAILTPWRYTQDMYRLDRDLFRELTKNPHTGTVPVEVLDRLPNWTVFIDWHDYADDIPESLREYNGAWISISRDLQIPKDHPCSLLSIVLSMTDGNYEIIEAPIYPGKTVDECIKYLLDTHNFVTKGPHIPSSTVTTILPLVLFLCVDEPKVRELYVPKSKRITTRKSKAGTRFRVPKRPRKITVGEDFGKTIRQFDAETNSLKRGGKTPHIRRAHWHSYRTGKRDGKQSLVVHWLPSNIIGVK